MESGSPQERFQSLLRKDRRFRAEAYNFVFEALDHTVRGKYGGPEDDLPVHRHVTGPELLNGIRELAIETYGCLAFTVLESWGVTQSGDFGEIVFNLVQHGLMGSQDSDKQEDFENAYGGRPFREVFSVRPVLEYYPERDEWDARYQNEISF